jgi:hypothetical protein
VLDWVRPGSGHFVCGIGGMMLRQNSLAVLLFVMLPLCDADAQGPPLSITPPSVAQGTKGKSTPGETLLYTFGNWKISYTSPNKAYHLTGVSIRPSLVEANSVTLSCHLNDDQGVIVPIWEYTLRTRPNVVLTFWSDDQSSHDITLPIEGGVMAMDRSSKNPSVGIFAQTLTSSKRFFAFSYDGKTLEFEVRHLPAANRRFGELCKTGPRL